LISILLESYFQEFGRIFKSTGRVDLKYNSSISESDLHIDRNDQCHQVVFTLGESRRRLVVKENENIVKLESFRNPTAFDGRFQHWVEEYKDAESGDRISIISYLVDVPESYKMKRMSAANLKDLLLKK
jgi:hypothetical protein